MILYLTCFTYTKQLQSMYSYVHVENCLFSCKYYWMLLDVYLDSCHLISLTCCTFYYVSVVHRWPNYGSVQWQWRICVWTGFQVTCSDLNWEQINFFPLLINSLYSLSIAWSSALKLTNRLQSFFFISTKSNMNVSKSLFLSTAKNLSCVHCVISTLLWWKLR